MNVENDILLLKCQIVEFRINSVLLYDSYWCYGHFPSKIAYLGPIWYKGHASKEMKYALLSALSRLTIYIFGCIHNEN